MKGKILIISSEQLTPDSTLGSIFELAQAKILKCEYDVSIISVQNQEPLILQVKSLIKNIVFFRLGRTRSDLLSVTKRLTRLIRGKQFWSQKYTIEGVEVYAGYGFNFRNTRTDQDFYDLWLAIAGTAYKHYKQDHGHPEVVHAHGRFLLAGLFAIKLKKEERIRYVYTEHS